MKRSLIILFLSFFSSEIIAQTTDLQKNMNLADQYRLAYRFEEAITLYSPIAKQVADTLMAAEAIKWMAVCENGRNMLRYVDKPQATGKQAVEIDRFFRFYDFNAGGHWALTPSSWFLAKPAGVDYISPVFVPDGNPARLFYASPSPQGETGWDIYVIKKIDGQQWSAPERLSDAVNSPANELFPYSPDGKTLYFSSDGHFGMGGFDLYKSMFDAASQTWSAPENLGFPYSSPFDDLLYVPDSEGRYAYFSSTREGEKGLITIYRIVQETNPIKQSLTDIREILRIAKLDPEHLNTVADTRQTALQSEQTDYINLAAKAEENHRKATVVQQELDKLRSRYEASKDEVSRNAIARQILTNETQLMQLQDTVQQSDAALYKAGEKLASKGIAIPSSKNKTHKTDFFVKPFAPQEQELVSLADLKIASPVASEPEVDFTFHIANKPEVYFDQPAPQGLVYRIQLGVFSNKVDVKLLRGITPVFVEKTPTGKWLYAAGQFTGYDAAAKVLPEVKKRNFSDAVIIARLNGKSISLKEARIEEAKPALNAASGNESYQIDLGVYPDGLPSALLKAVKTATNKDIAKSGNTYIIGGFSGQEEANRVKDVLLEKGFTGVKVEVVDK